MQVPSPHIPGFSKIFCKFASIISFFYPDLFSASDQLSYYSETSAQSHTAQVPLLCLSQNRTGLYTSAYSYIQRTVICI